MNCQLGFRVKKVQDLRKGDFDFSSFSLVKGCLIFYSSNMYITEISGIKMQCAHSKSIFMYTLVCLTFLFCHKSYAQINSNKGYEYSIAQEESTIARGLAQEKDEDLKDPSFIRWSGDYRLRGLAQAKIFNNSSEILDDLSHRLKLKGSFSPNDDIQAYFSVNFYGQLGGSPRGLNGLEFETLDLNQSSHQLQLLNAYAEWDLWDGLFLYFGRQKMSWTNEALFSENLDDNRPYSFDGLVFYYSDSILNFKLGALRVGDWQRQNDEELDPTEDTFFLSIELNGYLDLLENAQIFYLRTLRDSFEDADLGLSFEAGSFNRLGVSLNGETSNLFYTFDYINLSGDLNNGSSVSANMGHLKLGVKWGKEKNFKTSLIGHIDSGDKDSTTEISETYKPLYYNHHKYAGLMDLLAWGNLTYYGLALNYLPGQKQSLGLQFLSFARTTRDAGVSSIDYLGFDQNFITEEIMQNASGVTDKSLGFEIDLVYKKEYNSNAFIEFIAGAFLPGNYFEGYGRNKTIYSARITTGFSF